MRKRNITVSVTDAVYRNARVWCARCDASISETVQYILENLSRLPRALRAIHEADEAAAAAKAAAEFAAQPARRLPERIPFPAVKRWKHPPATVK